MEKLEILPKVVIRHPSRPIANFSEEQEVLNYFQNHFAKEALLTCSPSLFREYLKWENGKLSPKAKKKLILALYRYCIRMHHRSTPFGLLSSLAQGQLYWSDDSYMITSKSRKTTLDSLCLKSLLKRIQEDAGVQEHLRFSINETLFKFKNQYRYIEVKSINSMDEAEIRSIQTNPLINDLIDFAKGYRAYYDLIDFLAHYSDDQRERASFLQSLIDSQILVSELRISLSSKDYLNDIIQLLREGLKRGKYTKKIEWWIGKLIQLKLRLLRLDRHTHNRPSAYKALKKFLLTLKVPVETDSFLQIHQISQIQKVEKQSEQAFPNAKLMQLIEFLTHQKRPDNKSRLDDFTKRVNRRYGEQAVPLSELLDPELGLGYGANTNSNFSKSTPLGADILLKSKRLSVASNVNLGKGLGNLLEIALRENRYEIKLVDKDLSIGGNSNLKDIAATFSILLSKVRDENGDARFLIKDIGGANGLHYIGRFCNSDDGIKSIAESLASHEKAIYHNSVLTEFYHQSHGRSNNILNRPKFYEGEIHFLNRAIDPKSRINVEDIHACIKNGELKLYTKESEKRILPRLSSAHDFRYNTLPIYQLMGDMQSHQKIDDLNFSWEQYEGLTFLPRLVFDAFILRVAQWNFKASDLKSHTLDSYSFKCFKAKWHIPNRILLREGDRELMIDLGTDLGLQLLKEELNGNQIVTFYEYLKPDPNFLIDSSKASYHNEMILFVKNHSCEETEMLNRTSNTELTVNGEPSNWVYLKLYCNQSKADELINQLRPIIAQLLRTGIVDQWFFVRYRDPDHHLRVRFHLKQLRNRSLLYEVISSSIDEFLEDNLIWKHQFDTYQREVSRYGRRGMPLAEKVFYIDSEAYLKFNQAFLSIQKDEFRWQLGILYIHDLFDLFEIDLSRRISILSGVCSGFKREFGLDSNKNATLARQYRARKSIIFRLMSKVEQRNQQEGLIIGIAAERSLKMQQVVHQFLELEYRVEKIQFMLDLMHMSLNRLFISIPRVQEFVINDLLWNYYKSVKAIEKVESKSFQ